MLLFAEVVREGGFTGAARVLGITKQTVSERIAKLEGRLGVRLLERTTRRLRMTDAGGAYYERCAAIAAQIDEANGEVLAYQAEPSGILRVSAPALYGRRYLAPVVARYLLEHPKLRVELVVSDRRVDLIEEGFDVALRIGKLDDSSLTTRKLGESHVYCVASPGFLRSHGDLRPSALGTARTIGLRVFETWEVAGVRARVTPALVVNDLEMACDAALAGVGIARLPAILCGDAVREGRLCVLFGGEATVRPVYAVYPSRQHLPPKVRLFVDALAEQIEPMRPLSARQTAAAVATARAPRRPAKR
ncbi:Transcriptional regulator, LysR family [Labilithrix luteola]|uniref:Transcriptional regulator, LysR family n=2 Tax=Labilithrix luteola TaxID=1391654 RepID=A0A0K1PQL4_9BACT|nr:Transcriptional regulator, LysR family [Labilithrix luteola]